ncbi:MAG: lysylphosphatidylglycerol synthase transmembrane domain-containing protein [Actinomycetota bacterium]
MIEERETAAASGEPRRPRSRRRQVLQMGGSLALVVVIFVVVLPRIADFGEVWDRISDMTWLEAASLLLIAFWNVVTYCFVLVPTLPGLRYGQAFLVTQASTAAANTLPAGAGIGIGVTWTMYSSWGFTRAEITLSVLLSGIWNVFAKLALPVVALAALAVVGEATVGRLSAAAVGVGALVVSIALFAVMLRSEGGAQRVGRFIDRFLVPLRRLTRRSPGAGIDAAVLDFRHRTIGVLRRNWLSLTVGTLVSHLSLYAVLLLTLRHVGVAETDVGWAEVLAAFAFVRLVSAFPLTPGGLGVVELALTAALVAAGGDEEEVVAAVLIYRALTYALPVPLGGISYLIWRAQTARAAVRASVKP